MTHYVYHDGARWKVADDTTIDGEPGYELVRSFSNWDRANRVITRRVTTVFARVSECDPDTHQPKRVIRQDGLVLTFQTGVVTIKEKGRRTGHTATLKGLYQALAWQAARIKARDKAFKRRTTRR